MFTISDLALCIVLMIININTTRIWWWQHTTLSLSINRLQKKWSQLKVQCLCLFTLATHVRLHRYLSVKTCCPSEPVKKGLTADVTIRPDMCPLFFPPPFGTLNSWIIRSRIWVSSIYVNLKIGVSNVKHGLFEICRFVFIRFFLQ